MVIEIIREELIIETCEIALRKTGDDAESIKNINNCIGLLNDRCLNRGFRIMLSYSEFPDFFDMLKTSLRKGETVLTATFAKSTPVDILDKLRTLRDNAVGSVINVNHDTAGSTKNTVILETVKMKKQYSEEYAVDYAIRLLRYRPPRRD